MKNVVSDLEGKIACSNANRIPIPSDIRGRARQYYTIGYRDGLRGWAVVCPTRKYADAFWRGYDDGFDASGRMEVKAFEK